MKMSAPADIFYFAMPVFLLRTQFPSGQPGWPRSGRGVVMNIARAVRDITDLDSGVRPRNDNGLNIDFIFTNIVPSFYFTNIVPCFYFTGIVYVLVADDFVCVIPGPDPGIQVMVPNADTPA